MMPDDETKKKSLSSHNPRTFRRIVSQLETMKHSTTPLQWSHATNSLAGMKKAVEDPEITAIECDVMLGSSSITTHKHVKEPMLAHPPHRESDLTARTFLSLVTQVDNDGKKALQKHIKLDFKEIEAVQPTLSLISQACIVNPLGKIITLNADILPGPGRRNDNGVPASSFLATCLSYIQTFEV
jgi:hypothetical protein